MMAGLNIHCFGILVSTIVIVISAQKRFCPLPEDKCPTGNACSSDADCKENPSNKTTCCYNDRGCCLPAFQCKPSHPPPESCSNCDKDEDCGRSGITCCKDIKTGCCATAIVISVPNKREDGQNEFCVTIQKEGSLTITDDTYNLQCNPPDKLGTDECRYENSTTDQNTSPSMIATTIPSSSDDPSSSSPDDNTSPNENPSSSSPDNINTTTPLTTIPPTTKPTTTTPLTTKIPMTTPLTTTPTTTLPPTTTTIWNPRCPKINNPVRWCLECNPRNPSTCSYGMVCCPVPQRASGCCMNV